jgi:NAD(P)-dependent dehydrogenase (short-subunit alcohol dehydrogenase family)
MTYPLPNNSVDLTGQVALVTGASSGLGVRFGEVLAACGATVVLAARRVDRLEKLAADIRARGGKALPLALDATDFSSFKEKFDEIEKQVGPVTILVNNAGVFSDRDVVNLSIEEISSILHVNLHAPLFLSREFARRLIPLGRSGRIVNIASIGAFDIGPPPYAAYSISKAGIIKMTQSLAQNWAANNINVNAIAPGGFESEMCAGLLEIVGDTTQLFPRKRMGNPAQLDSTILYLVSPASDMVTGAYVLVNDAQFGNTVPVTVEN